MGKKIIVCNNCKTQQFHYAKNLCSRCYDRLIVYPKCKDKKNAANRAKRFRFGMCPICGREKRLVYDHNHKTTRFRDWICISCNLILGLVRDSTLTLEIAIEYLEKHH